MFSNEVYEMLQVAFRLGHKTYPFPKSEFKKSPKGFQKVMGIFAKELNHKISKDTREMRDRLDEEISCGYKHHITRLNDEISSLKFSRTLLAFMLGISVAVNIVVVFF